jgi:hypothetical protein
MLAVWPEEARALGHEVAASAERGVAIRTLCLAGCPEECGACRGRIHRYRMRPQQTARWLLVIPDAAEVLAGAISPAEDARGAGWAARAVRTQQRLLVDLSASYIRHSIALAAVLGDAGERLAPLLSPASLEALQLVSEQDGLESWLGRLSRLLAGGPTGGDA